MKLFFWLLFLLIPYQSYSSTGRVRRIAVHNDQVATVKTALGIATIVQVPDRPNSLVVGNTEAFKVEYLDQAITIKPLFGGARSNLYIYTDYKRFNVQLITGTESAADYVVYLDNHKNKEYPKESKPSLIWKQFKGTLTNESTALTCSRIGRTSDGILVVEFRLKSTSREKIDPKWFWLTQNGKTVPIHRLVLSGLDVDAKNSREGMIQILKSDVSGRSPFRLELRRKRTSYLTIPEFNSWK